MTTLQFHCCFTIQLLCYFDIFIFTDIFDNVSFHFPFKNSIYLKLKNNLRRIEGQPDLRTAISNFFKHIFLVFVHPNAYHLLIPLKQLSIYLMISACCAKKFCKSFHYF